MSERRVDKIYLHCSVSRHGNENVINSWHKARRFLTMVDGHHLSTGYHLVIGNGCPFSDKRYYNFLDGQIETARSFATVGAGVKSDNMNTIHVCLIGMPGDFTDAQMTSLFQVLLYFHITMKIPIDQIWGHYEFWTRKKRKPMKTCPGLDMDDLRSSFQDFIVHGQTPEPIEKTKIKPADSKLHAMLRKFDSILGGRA